MIPITVENFKKIHGVRNHANFRIQTITEKIMLIGYLILAEIKYSNLNNEHFEKRAQNVKKQHKNFIFH